jgi:hypothetical protein
MKCLVKKILFFILSISISEGICQITFPDAFLSQKISETVMGVKDKMTCNLVDTIKFPGVPPCGKEIDTTLFEYIPIINGCISFPNTLSTCHSNFLIIEVLLFHKKDKKITGSGQIGKKGEIYLSFLNPRQYLPGIPMRYESRINYISSKDYSRVSKLVVEGDGILIYISEIKVLCFFNKEGVFKGLIPLELKQV